MSKAFFHILRGRLKSVSASVFFTCCVLSAVVFSPFSSASTLPSGFVDAKLASGFDRPTQMEIAPDGRIFVLQQGGKVIIYKNGVKLSTPFITLSNVFSTQDYGLLGIAFDPNFSVNKYVYLYYAVNGTAPFTRVSRVTAAGDVVQAGSEVVLYTLDTFAATTHQGGALHFGKDGKLYLFTGTPDDNMPAAQSFTSTKGKVLRLNSDGSIPTDNPFYTSTTGKYRAIFARGLRNPFTAAIQPGTGRIFAADNGKDSWEEVNDVVAGANFGWPVMEGNVGTPPTGYKGPFFTYAHLPNTGSSIVAASFYNPTTNQFPAVYVGKFLFADLILGEIRYINPAVTTPTATVFASGLSLPIDMKIGADGTLYYLTRGDGVDPTQSALYRVQYTASQAPSITQNPVNITVSAGETARFCVSASGSAPLTFQWLKNNLPIAGATATCYTTPATTAQDDGSTFSMTATNPVGSVTSAAATLRVSSNRRPTATITLPATGAHYNAGDTLSFAGSGFDPEDGNLPASAFTWWVDFHHNTHAHSSLPQTTGITSGTLPISINDEKSSDVFIRIHLRVTDAQGLTDEKTLDVLPNLVTLTLSTVPAGLTLTLDGANVTTPYSWVSVAGIEWNFAAPATALVSGSTYTFSRWSNGLAAAHTLRAPATATTYTATYTAASGLPSITTQPVSRSVAVGATASFSVVAAGTAPLTYQWRKNGVNITGATAATYTTPATVAGDNNALFSVVVRNAAGSATSTNATLTVTAAATCGSANFNKTATKSVFLQLVAGDCVKYTKTSGTLQIGSWSGKVTTYDITGGPQGVSNSGAGFTAVSGLANSALYIKVKTAPSAVDVKFDHW